jgi:vacuolar-type H+-ATPase subunit H
MTGLKTNDSDFSPLDRVRLVEADVTRQIAAARQAAELSVSEARKQVKALLEQARKSGRIRGQTRYKEIVSEADEEASALVARARLQADDLHRLRHQCMDEAVHYAVSFIMGQEGNGEDR